MNQLKRSFFTAQELKPTGWLKRQLEIQAAGLAGNLDKVWPDVRDSRWIGGDKEGWERVPYWLDGFIPLAWMLDDEGLKHRATRYIDAIIDRQEPDGWICPCNRSERPKYDTWAVLLIGKVLISYYDCTGDRRALYVSLTAAGESAAEAVAQLFDRADRQASSLLTQAETEHLTALLEKVCAALPEEVIQG